MERVVLIVIDMTGLDGMWYGKEVIDNCVTNTNQLIRKVRKCNGTILWAHYFNNPNAIWYSEHLRLLNDMKFDIESKDLYIHKRQPDLFDDDNTMPRNIVKYSSLVILTGYRYDICVKQTYESGKSMGLNICIARDCTIADFGSIGNNLNWIDDSKTKYKHYRVLRNSTLLKYIGRGL